ncbi:MAG TPA: hypothetical protein VMV33_12510 [Rhodocyclaceae bacterium]|nr:hypothetical protein [Rhodocyclaceae bacterium]
MDEELRAIEASCYTLASEETSAAPKCAVEYYIGGKRGLLFVKPPVQAAFCRYQHSFGNGHFCTSENRLQVYLKYGI